MSSLSLPSIVNDNNNEDVGKQGWTGAGRRRIPRNRWKERARTKAATAQKRIHYDIGGGYLSKEGGGLYLDGLV